MNGAWFLEYNIYDSKQSSGNEIQKKQIPLKAFCEKSAILEATPIWEGIKDGTGLKRPEAAVVYKVALKA